MLIINLFGALFSGELRLSVPPNDIRITEDVLTAAIFHDDKFEMWLMFYIFSIDILIQRRAQRRVNDAIPLRIGFSSTIR